jgi:hypothetical protein
MVMDGMQYFACSTSKSNDLAQPRREETMQRLAGQRTIDGLRLRRDEILRVCAEFGASNVRVFGSVARDEDDEKSDIDPLVDFDGNDTRTSTDPRSPDLGMCSLTHTAILNLT